MKKFIQTSILIISCAIFTSCGGSINVSGDGNTVVQAPSAAHAATSALSNGFRLIGNAQVSTYRRHSQGYTGNSSNRRYHGTYRGQSGRTYGYIDSNGYRTYYDMQSGRQAHRVSLSSLGRSSGNYRNNSSYYQQRRRINTYQQQNQVAGRPGVFRQ